MHRFLILPVFACWCCASNAMAQTEPDDPLFDSQWYLFSEADHRGHPGSINAVQAWAHVQPAEPVTVAVLGAGVNFTHPDLADNVWVNSGEARNLKDDDGNGFVDDINGWDFASGDSNPVSQPYADNLDHDSMVASLIAAVPNNGIGIAGVGRNIRIMPVRTTGDYALLQRTADGMHYAMDHGARVIVCTQDLHQILQFIVPAIERANKADVLFVCSAGNAQRFNIDEDLKELGGFPNVLIVAGSRKDGSLAPLCFGRLSLIAAPCEGMQLLSYNDYASVSHMGTSWAAPIAAAVAATLISQEPTLKPAEVIERIRRSSTVHSSMEGKLSGGRIDMLRVLSDSAAESARTQPKDGELE